MSSSLVARRGALAALTVLAAATLFLLGLAQGSAGAAEVNGNGIVTINTGKAGKATAIAPAKGKRVGKKGVKANAPVKSLSFIGSTAKAGLKGGIKLSNGKRSVKITGLSLTVGKGQTVVRGKLGKRNLVVFTAKGKTNVNSAGKSVKVAGAKLTLSKSVGKKIKRSLKLRKVPSGKIGSLNLNATIKSDVDPCVANPDSEGCPIVDPYLAQCDVAATSKVTGSLPAAAALPTLTGPEAVTGPTAINWGFKTSFRNYLASPAAGGSIHALDGATATGAAPAFAGIDFPVSDGQYFDNGTADLSDDGAIINTTGTLVLCGTKHNFRVAISDPTFVAAGNDVRVIADVDTNLTGVWTPAQRVDLARFDAPGEILQEVAGSGSSIDLGSLAGTLTSSGADAICGTGEQAACNYTDETPVDDLNVKVEVASAMPTSDPYQAQCGVPVAKVASRTWSSVADEPLPPLQSPIATTGPSSIDWGFKSSFRGYVQYSPPAGTFQGLDGASTTGGPSPAPFTGFSFPVSDGLYESGVAGDPSDDQAIVNGTGTALFCKAGHGFWASITNPTIVIDGSDSRIEATISQNLNGTDGSGAWSTPERVDLARLNLDEIDPIYNYSGSEVTWSDIPVTALQDFATYTAGTELDPISITVNTPYDTGAGDAAAWDALATYVETNHPFPNPAAATGGCEVGVPAGGSSAAARTIDEHAALGGTTTSWSATPTSAVAAPALTGTAVTGGGLDWGFRRSLRASINATGDFNVAGGAVASDSTYVGNGGSLGMRTAPGVPAGGQMGDAGDYFTWPAESGTYKANAAGDADDQLVLRTEGAVAFCQVNSAQRYGITFANPTVVIDGANSRITIDATARYRLSWVRATVDFATIDLTGISIGSNTAGGVTTKTWTFPDATGTPAVGPITLTTNGERIAKMLSTAYVAGLGLDGATIRASFPE